MSSSRREFLKAATVASMAVASSVNAQSALVQAPGGAKLRTLETSVLTIGYEEHGDSAGFPIILLHGFPYDVRSFDGVVSPLVAAGYRVLLP